MAKVVKTVNPQATAFEALPNNTVLDNPRQLITPGITSGLGAVASDINLDDYSNVKNRFLTGDDSLDRLSLDETRAKNQSALGLIGKGIGNVGATFLSEIAKIPGYVGGLSADIVTGNIFKGDFSNTVDNFWLNGIDWVKRNTTDEAFKVYTPPSLEGEGLLGQVLNPYFWAKEGADGVGFLLSFLAPGQALKLLNLGGKASKLIGKTGRVLDYEKIAATIDSGLAVGVNTLLESAAEGSNAYDNLIQQGYTPEEAGKLASNVVKWNIPTLLFSNLILEKYIMSGFGRLQGKSGFNRITTDVIEGSKTLKKQWNPLSASKIGIGVTQEGLFEEGLQTSIEQVNGKSAYDIMTKYWNNLTTMFNDDADSDAIDFGKSVILGGVLGGGMSTLGNVQEIQASNRALFGQKAYTPRNTFEKFVRGKSREAKEGLISVFKSNYAAIKQDAKELFEYNDKGEIMAIKPDALKNINDNIGTNLLVNFYHDLIRKYDGNVNKAKEELYNTMIKAPDRGAIGLSDIFRVAQDLSNSEVIEQIKNREDFNYFMNFLVHPEGSELLREHIPGIAKQIAERYKANTGNELTDIRSVEKELSEKAERYIEIYDKVKKAHSPYRLQVDPFKSGNQPDRAEKYKMFFNKAKLDKLAMLSDIDLATQRIKHLEELKEKLSTSNSAIDKHQLDVVERDLVEYSKMQEEAEEQYLKLDNTKSLQELWEKAYAGSLKVDEEVAKEEAEEVTVEDFEKKMTDIRTQNGYEEFDNVHFMNNGTRFTITKQQDGKYAIRNEKDPSKVSIVDSTVLSNKNSFIPKADVIKQREARKIREAAEKEKLRQQAIVTAVTNKLLDAQNGHKAATEALNKVNEDIVFIKELIEGYKKQIAAKKGVREAKRLLAKAQETLNSLEEVRDELTNENEVYKDQESLLTEMTKNPEYIEQAKSLFPEVNETIELLKVLISNIESQIEEVTNNIVSLTDLRDTLKASIALHDIVNYQNNRILSEEIAEKYSYIDDNGVKHSLPNKSAGFRLSREIENFVKELAKYTGFNENELLDDIAEDYKKLDVDKTVTENVEEYFYIGNRIKELEQILNELNDLLSEAKTKSNLKVYQGLSSELNSRFKSIKRSSTSKDRLKETGVSQFDKPESEFNTSEVWWDKISSYLFATSGLHIEYGDDNKDLLTTTNGIVHPVMSSSIYKKTWFNYLATEPELSNVKLLLTVANYDGSSELERAFAANNPNSQEKGKDVYAVLADKSGKPMTHNGVLLFAPLKRIETMFPDGKQPGINLRALARRYGSTIGVRNFVKPNAQEQKKLLEVFGTATPSPEQIQAKSIEWGKAEYTNFITTIQNNKQMIGVIGEISAGHPIVLRDATTNEVLQTNPIKGLDLKFNPDGTPANFEVYQADKTGSVVIGSTIKSGLKTGVVYIYKNNQLTPVESDMLNEDEIDLIFNMLLLFSTRDGLKGFVSPHDIKAKGFTKDKYMFIRGNKIDYSDSLESKRLAIFPTKESRFSLMTMLMNWGEFGNPNYDIYIYKGMLTLGTVEIPINKLKENEDLIKNFLAKKRFHINFSLLNSASKSFTPYFHPVKMENGEIIFEEKKFLPYVLQRMKTSIMPKAEYDKLGLPQFAQKNLEIVSMHLPGKPIVLTEEVDDVVPIEPEIPNPFDDAMAEMGLNFNPLYDIAGSTPEDLYDVNDWTEIPDDMPIATADNAPELFGKKSKPESETIETEPITTDDTELLFGTTPADDFVNTESKDENIPIFKKMNTFEVLNELIDKGDINKQC